LQQRILRADPALDVRAAPVTAARPVVPVQLPADIPGFLGRVDELTALDALLVDGSMIAALSGTAGVGKTALAVHWAHRARPAFPHGQLYVDLRGYDPKQPMTTGEALTRLLEAVGVSGPAVPVELDARAARYRTEIADRRMLVVLDNASSVDQVRDLLPGTASCAVVVTSRDHLAGLVALHGARRLDLDPLPMDDATTLLRRLIGDRAAADPGAVRLLASQCAQLPLALRVTAELAVSRPDTPLARLAEELGDGQRRLRLLDGGGHDRAAVRAVFSWSYRHLPPDAAQLFRRLSGHPGPDFDVRAAAATGQLTLADAERLLGLLSRANVLQPRPPGRYGMHDLLRAYATELADANDLRAARNRLFDYYLAAAAAATDVLYPVGRAQREKTDVPEALLPPTSDRALPRAWLNAERANLVALCRYAANHGWQKHAVRLSAVLYRYLEAGGHFTDALEIHTCAVDAASQTGDRSGRAHALTNLGLVHRLLGRYAPATDHLRRALDLHRLTGDLEGEARALSNLGIVEDRLGHAAAAGDWLGQALDLYRELDNKHGTAAVLTNLGGVHNGTGEHAQAAANLAEALVLFRELGDQGGEASALVNLGEAESRSGNGRAALGHFAAALALFREMNHRYGQAVALSNLGTEYSRLGQHDEAVPRFSEALDIFRDTGHRYGEASALNGLGEALHDAGLPGALTEHSAALAIATETGDRDEQARAHTGAARVHQHDGEPELARDHWRQALRLYTELNSPEAERVRGELAGA
jgi:tetratricopeptide (TPR) repeat protein